VTEFLQLRAATVQLASELDGRELLSDAAKNQNQLGWTPLGPLKDRFGKDGGDAVAGGTSIDQDWSAVAAMDLEIMATTAMRAGQASLRAQFQIMPIGSYGQGCPAIHT
jgi:hypothetical protein